MDSSYFIARIVLGIMHITIASMLLFVLYSVYRSKNTAPKYFLYTAISIFFSLLAGIVGISLDNNFIVNWDYTHATRFITTGDGYVAPLWSVSKFTFYLTFLFHIKHLAKESETALNYRVLDGVTLICGLLTVFGSCMFTVGDSMVVNPTDELLFVDGDYGNIQMVSYVDDSQNMDNMIRKYGGAICGFADVIFFLFLMFAYHKLSKQVTTDSNHSIGKEIIRGNVLLFLGSLTTWLFFFCLVNNFKIYFCLLWIDMMVDDCCAVLLLEFTKHNFGILCALCDACCSRLYGRNTAYRTVTQHTEDDNDDLLL